MSPNDYPNRLWCWGCQVDVCSECWSAAVEIHLCCWMWRIDCCHHDQFQCKHVSYICMQSVSSIHEKFCQLQDNQYQWRCYLHCWRMTRHQIHPGIHMKCWWSAVFLMACRQCPAPCWWWHHDEKWPEWLGDTCRQYAECIVGGRERDAAVYVQTGQNTKMETSVVNISCPKWLTFFQNANHFCCVTPKSGIQNC